MMILSNNGEREEGVMTREEAVKLLQATRLMLMDGANQPISDLYYALDMAIEALEQTEPQTETMPELKNIGDAFQDFCDKTDIGWK